MPFDVTRINGIGSDFRATIASLAKNTRASERFERVGRSPGGARCAERIGEKTDGQLINKFISIWTSETSSTEAEPFRARSMGLCLVGPSQSSLGVAIPRGRAKARPL